MTISARGMALSLPGALAAALLVAALALVLVDPRAALTGWLAASVAFAAVPAGSVCLLAMMRLIPGAWGEDLRLSCEAGSLLALPALAAFVPVMLGSALIYPWGRQPPGSAFQAFWLGPLAFALRTMAWFGLLWWASRELRARRRTGAVAAGGLVAFALLGSVVADDWLMALDARFASSAFGLQNLVLWVLLAFAVLLRLRLSVGRAPGHPAVLGGVLLTLLLLWAYIQFLTFFIAWSADMPDNARWYLARTGGWSAVAGLFGLLGGVPLLALLFPAVRGDPRRLGVACIAVIAGKLLEFAWFALPGSDAVGIAADVLASAGLVLATMAGFGLALRRRIGARRPA